MKYESSCCGTAVIEGWYGMLPYCGKCLQACEALPVERYSKKNDMRSIAKAINKASSMRPGKHRRT